jgi:hypothetical protein
MAERHGRQFVRPADLFRLSLRQANASDLRIREDGPRHEAVVTVAATVAQHEVKENTVVVPGCVCELRAARHIAYGENAISTRAIARVDLDEATFVEIDAAYLATKIVGVRLPAHGDQQVRTIDRRIFAQAKSKAADHWFQRSGFDTEVKRDTLIMKHGLQSFRHFRVFSIEDTSRALYETDG